MGLEIDATTRIGQRPQQKWPLDLQPCPLQDAKRPGVKTIHLLGIEHV